MVDGLIALAVIVFWVGAFLLGFYYGKRNYRFSPHEKNVIKIEVDTAIAEARLRDLKKEVISITKEFERLNNRAKL